MSEHRATEYTVYPTGYKRMVHSDKTCWTIEVTDSGLGWAVRWLGWCLNADEEWEYEPSPSNRDDDFFARCRFAKDDALSRAHVLVDSLVVNSLTAQQASDSVAARRSPS